MTTSVESIPADALLATVREMVSRSRHHAFPVIDEAGRPVGLLRRDAVGRLGDSGLDERRVRERMDSISLVTPTTMLGEVARLLVEPALRMLAVVDLERDEALVGVMTRSDVLRAYQDGLLKRFKKKRRASQPANPESRDRVATKA